MYAPLSSKIRHRIAAATTALLMAVLLFFGCSLTVQAVEVSGLYVVDLPVSSQQASVRKEVASIGLERVIRRVSGSSGALTQATVQTALQTPERYLQEFSYFVATQQSSGKGQRLRLQFDRTLVNQLLRQAKQPIWGSNRPNLMMWVAVENKGRRAVVSNEDTSVWRQAIKRAGNDSGVPILLPLMDLLDESSISVMDVWGLFRDRLEDASRRYRSEAVLGGRLYRTETNQWAGRWLLIFDEEAVSFSTRGAQKQHCADEALAYVADLMAARYAVDTASETSTQIKLGVQGVKGLDDYARLKAYLQGFAMVQDVAVSEVESDRLTLVLTTEGDWHKLKGLIALDRQLLPLAEAVPEFEGGVMVMPYQWRR